MYTYCRSIRVNRNYCVIFWCYNSKYVTSLTTFSTFSLQFIIWIHKYINTKWLALVFSITPVYDIRCDNFYDTSWDTSYEIYYDTYLWHCSLQLEIISELCHWQVSTNMCHVSCNQLSVACIALSDECWNSTCQWCHHLFHYLCHILLSRWHLIMTPAYNRFYSVNFCI